MYIRVWILLFGFCQSLNMTDILHELSWRLKLKMLIPKKEPDSPSKGEYPPPSFNLLHVTTTTKLPTTATKLPMTITKLSKTTTKLPMTKPEKAMSLEPITTILLIKNSEGVNSSITTLDENTREARYRRAYYTRKHKKHSVGGVTHLGQSRREVTTDDPKTDEKNMCAKLFQLMYETVRDNAIKFKRAELIKEHYANSSEFEIGYLIGEITDKENIINDISTTLKNFYNEWNPIEHIDAYEQIMNQANEITHIIDLARMVNRKSAKYKSHSHSSGKTT